MKLVALRSCATNPSSTMVHGHWRHWTGLFPGPIPWRSSAYVVFAVASTSSIPCSGVCAESIGQGPQIPAVFPPRWNNRPTLWAAVLDLRETPVDSGLVPHGTFAGAFRGYVPPIGEPLEYGLSFALSVKTRETSVSRADPLRSWKRGQTIELCILYLDHTRDFCDRQATPRKFRGARGTLSICSKSKMQYKTNRYMVWPFSWQSRYFQTSEPAWKPAIRQI